MNRHLARGHRLAELQRHAEAAREFIRSAAHADNPAHSLALAAGSRLADGDIPGARDLLQQARRLDPDDRVVLLTGVQLCVPAGEAAEARSLFAQILRREPECPDLLGSAAWMEIALENYPASRRYAEAGLAIDPVHEACLEAMITALGSAPEAAAYTRRLLAAWPENAEAHRALVGIAFNNDRLSEAADHAHEAVRLDPNSPDSLERLAATRAHRHPVFQFLVEGHIGRHHFPALLRVACLFIPTLVWFLATLALSVYLGDKTLAGFAPWTTWIDRSLRPQSLAAAWAICLLGWQGAYTLLCAIFSRAFRPLLRARRGHLLLIPGFGVTATGALLAYVVTGDWAFYGAAFLALSATTTLGMLVGARSFPVTKCTLAAVALTLSGLVIAVLGHFFDFPSGILLWSLVLLNITAFLMLKPRGSPATTPPPVPSP